VSVEFVTVTLPIEDAVLVAHGGSHMGTSYTNAVSDLYRRVKNALPDCPESLGVVKCQLKLRHNDRGLSPHSADLADGSHVEWRTKVEYRG
jgi:hypothetical protein